MKSKILLMVAVFALPLLMQANNVRVKLNSYNAATKQLNITLAWDNSWHDGSGQFRDAAWLFVKYKDITNPEWQHAVLGTPNGAGGNTPAVLTDTLNSPGVLFDVQAKRAGVSTGAVTGYMVRRQKSATVATQNNPEYAGVYNVAMSFNVVVTLPAGVSLANPEFRVYALEMVDVPTGSFWVGDGSNPSVVKASLVTNAPVNITSPTTAVSAFVNGNAKTIGGSTYPNGYNEFFMMKYELSNEGYCEFMNTLTRAQQNALAETSAFTTATTGFLSGFNHYSNFGATFTSLTDPAVFGSDANRNGVFNEPNDGQNNGVIVNYMRAIPSYLDWAGLRVASGLEFEKACRGPLYPVQGEYAWGNSTINIATIDVDQYGISESASVSVNGPVSGTAGLRNGVFAKATGSTRLNSGGSYYGIMELSNSCNEAHTGYGENPIWENWPAPNGDGIINPNYSGQEFVPSGGAVSLLPLYRSSDLGVYGSPISGSTATYTNITQGIRGVIK